MSFSMEFKTPIKAKEAFYEMASRAELEDYRAKIRFHREPWYLTDKKMREGRIADGQTEGRADEHSRV